MIRLREFLLQYVFEGKNAVITFDEDDEPGILIVHSQEQASEFLSQCALLALPSSGFSPADDLLSSRLQLRSHLTPIRIGGAMAKFFRQVEESLQAATESQMLAMDSANRVRMQYMEDPEREPVGVIHATVETKWRVHLVWSILQARQVLLEYQSLVPEQLAHNLLVVDTSPLPEESKQSAISVESDAALTLGLRMEGYWQIKNVFEAPARLV